jgi:hypothetical protein
MFIKLLFASNVFIYRLLLVVLAAAGVRSGESDWVTPLLHHHKLAAIE